MLGFEPEGSRRPAQTITAELQLEPAVLETTTTTTTTGKFWAKFVDTWRDEIKLAIAVQDYEPKCRTTPGLKSGLNSLE